MRPALYLDCVHVAMLRLVRTLREGRAMLMAELHQYPVDEISYASSGELMGPEELDGFRHQHVGISTIKRDEWGKQLLGGD